MTTARQVNKIAAAIADRIAIVTAAPNDPRVKSGQLITVEQGRRLIVRKLRRLFGKLERIILTNSMSWPGFILSFIC